MKKNRMLIYVVIFIGLAIAMRLMLGSDEPWKQLFKDYDYSGRIVNKFLDSNGKHLDAITIEGNNSWYYVGNDKIYQLIQPGDYIIKKKGTLKHILVHQNDTIVFYPQTFHNQDLKDE